MGRWGQCPEGYPPLDAESLVQSRSARNINGVKKRRKAAPAEIPAEVVVPVEEVPPIYEDDVPDEPVGLFNEFGAPDPQGLPIEEVFNEPEVVVPAVVPAVAGPKWVDIPILDAREAVIGRRGAVVETMIPKFLGRSAGHQNIPADIMRNKRPIDFFFIFLSDDILTRFCNATNDYAAMIESKSWGELTIPEFKVFICIIVFMGIVKLPERVMYWQKGQFGQQFPQKLMSARRFEQILSHWHWILVEEDDRAARKAANPFYLVDGFVERLARNCQHYWKLDQFVDIDEMSIYYKGRHKCRCYNPNKPEKWHFKAFCLNDGQTGYLWNYYLYMGASEVREPGWSATAYPIKKLTEPFTTLHHKAKNYIMCTDNWYTSFEIAVYLLKTYGIHLIGTIKTNRTGLPKEKIFTDKGRNKKHRGDMAMSKTDIDGHSYYFTAWMDSRPVHGLSTLPTTKSMVQRKMKEDPNGPFRTVQVPRPDMWRWYNYGMGGTDLHDQFNKYYRTTVRCNKWAIRIYTHFITSCVTNAYILYKSAYDLETKDLSLMSFIMEVLSDVASKPQQVAPDSDDSDSEDEENRVRGQYKKRKKVDSAAQYDLKSHWPVKLKHFHGEGKLIRGGCRVCKQKVSTKCKKCDAYLCLEGDGDMSCFEEFHTR